MSARKTTIIIPVYGDWPSLHECIESLKENIDTSRDRVVLVNDCGPDVELMEKNITASIAGHAGFTYFRNSKNLGFIGTCNRAVNELDQTDNDVLLLNSDTTTTSGFLDELRNVLYAENDIGTVSPRSNNATICTVPLSAMPKKGIDAKKSYEFFQKYHRKFPRFDDVPTAHGFCMLIRRSLIKKYGLFDTTFGKGYGEEVDFCRRIKEHGWRSVLSHHSYVFHSEARSFSMETKNKLLEKNSQIIRDRYPSYKAEVQEYVKDALAAEQKIYGRAGQPRFGTAKKLLKKSRTIRNVVTRAKKARRN